jgi:hypothetical protein
MSFIIPLVTGVLSGFIASLIFIIFFSRIRPNIKISDKICYSFGPILFPDELEGKPIYEIKAINRSRRAAINLRAELQIVAQRFTKGGPVQYWKDIALVRPNPMHIEKYNKKDTEGLYAFRFRTFENLDPLWSDDDTAFLRFRLVATDSLSGFSKVFVRNYYTKKDYLVEGRFASSDSFEIS